jgi:hypothetical protein
LPLGVAGRLIGEQETPVARLLRRMNDAAIDEFYRDKLAALVAPYLHPRLSLAGEVKLPSAMTDSELEDLVRRTQADIARRDGQPWPRLAVDNNSR